MILEGVTDLVVIRCPEGIVFFAEGQSSAQSRELRAPSVACPVQHRPHQNSYPSVADLASSPLIPESLHL